MSHEQIWPFSFGSVWSDGLDFDPRQAQAYGRGSAGEDLSELGLRPGLELLRRAKRLADFSESPAVNQHIGNLCRTMLKANAKPDASVERAARVSLSPTLHRTLT
jgi:hypothetical protein